MKEKLTKKTFSDSNCRNEVAHRDKELAKITGILTCRVSIREDYYYGFFKIPDQELDVPVIFKTKPELVKGSQVQLKGTWATSRGGRSSFTCFDYKLIAGPPQPTLKSLLKTLQPLLSTCLEKKSEWTTRTDYLFKKKRDLEEIERMSKLGATYLKAYLLTKQAFYANYQSEHLEQADFSLETYLARINSELDRESSHIQAYLRKENK